MSVSIELVTGIFRTPGVPPITTLDVQFSGASLIVFGSRFASVAPEPSGGDRPFAAVRVGHPVHEPVIAVAQFQPLTGIVQTAGKWPDAHSSGLSRAWSAPGLLATTR